jgi:hypothetical protein
VFLGDAHRESGVFSLCFALSPVESCSPPKPFELTPSGVRPSCGKCKRRNEEMSDVEVNLWKSAFGERGAAFARATEMNLEPAHQWPRWKEKNFLRG